MNAIELLTSQHREVERLFSKIDEAETPRDKRRVLEGLADRLAAHATIEEHHFYPAVRGRRTEDVVFESLAEHLGMKRLLADLVLLPAEDETFDVRIKVLKELVKQHTAQEEKHLFRQAKKLIEEDDLETLGQRMSAELLELAAGRPREAAPSEANQRAFEI